MNKYVMKRSFFSILRYLILICFAFIFLFPFYQLIISSFLQSDMIVSYPPKYWPTGGDLSNYVKVLTDKNGIYLRWMLNSFLVAALNTFFVILFSTMAGYAFAKRSFPGKNLIFTIVISTQIIPGIVTLIPQFLMISSIGWANTYQALAVPSMANAFGVFMMTQFMKDIPDSLIEAATIDGSGAYKTFFTIIFPVTMPQVSLLGIFTFMGSWGNYIWPSVVISSNQMKTLPLGISSMKDITGSLTGEIMAASVMSFIPLLIAFMIAKEKFIEGMTIGAVKG